MGRRNKRPHREENSTDSTTNSVCRPGSKAKSLKTLGTSQGWVTWISAELLFQRVCGMTEKTSFLVLKFSLTLQVLLDRQKLWHTKISQRTGPMPCKLHTKKNKITFKHIFSPRKGFFCFLAQEMAWIFPSVPRTPKPPGTKTPLNKKEEVSWINLSIHFTFALHLSQSSEKKWGSQNKLHHNALRLVWTEDAQWNNPSRFAYKPQPWCFIEQL